MSTVESLERSENIRNEALGWIPYNCVKAQLPVLIEYAVENPPGTLKVEYGPVDDLFAKETLSIRYVEPIPMPTPDNSIAEFEEQDDTESIQGLSPKTIGEFALQIWIELNPITAEVYLFSRTIGKNRNGFVDDVEDRIELKYFNSAEEKMLASLTGGIDKNTPDYEKEFLKDCTKLTHARELEILQVFGRIDGQF